MKNEKSLKRDRKRLLRTVVSLVAVFSILLTGAFHKTYAADTHTHSWEYVLSSTKSNNDTITAVCANSLDGCKGTDFVLTISGQSAAYDGNSHNADFGDAESFMGGALPEISYECWDPEEEAYVPVTDTKDVGLYRASFTVGSGDGKKTASVEYAVSKKPINVSGTTVKSKVYDGNDQAEVILGTPEGIVTGDDVTVSAEGAFSETNVGEGIEVAVTYTLSGDDAKNYGTPEGSGATANITKASPKAEDFVFTAPVSLIYDQTEKTAAVEMISGITGMGNITIQYYSDPARTMTAVPKNTGTYYVGISVSEGTNFLASTGVLSGEDWEFVITATYELVNGDHGVWEKKSGKDYTLTVKRTYEDEQCFENFRSVEVDGTLLTKGEDYTAKAGSTVITLKASMLEKLSNGKHKVTVNFADGQSETTLTVRSASGDVPDTGDGRDSLRWTVLLLTAAAGMFGAVLYRNRKKEEIG